jgi:hypothetical protein
MDERIKKLPAWAQELIADLAREREVAVRALNGYLDGQTKSSFYIDNLECTGENTGPSKKTQYIQTHKMEVEHAGVRLSIILRDDRIDLQWEDVNRGMSQIAFVPRSYQSAELVAKGNMK